MMPDFFQSSQDRNPAAATFARAVRLFPLDLLILLTRTTNFVNTVGGRYPHVWTQARDQTGHADAQNAAEARERSCYRPRHPQRTARLFRPTGPALGVSGLHSQA